jgi:hypothetical protein
LKVPRFDEPSERYPADERNPMKSTETMVGATGIEPVTPTVSR